MIWRVHGETAQNGVFSASCDRDDFEPRSVTHVRRQRRQAAWDFHIDV